MEDSVDGSNSSLPLCENMADDRSRTMGALCCMHAVIFFAPDKLFGREAEQNVQDADENDPIAREMTNLDVLDQLEKQATRESHYASNFACF